MPDNSSNEWLIPQRQPPASHPKQQISTKTMADLLFLPESERSLMNWLLRQQSASLAEVTAFLAQDESAAQAILEHLIAQEFVRLVELNQQLCYEPNLASRRGRQVPSNIWNALDA